MRPSRLLFGALALVLGLAGPARAQIHGPHEERVKQVKELAKQGDLEATKKIVGFLKDPHPFPRDAAFLALCGLKDEKAIDWLATEALGVGDAEVRADVIEALGELKAKKAVPGLVKLLSSDTKNRQLICEVLGAIGSPAEAEALLKIARGSGDARARAAALEAAVRLDPAKAAEAAKIAEKDPPPDVRVGAIRALVAADPALGVPTAVAALAERVAAWEKKKDRDHVGPWQPALAAMKALARVQDRAKHREALAEAVGALIPLVGFEKGRMKHEAHMALVDLTGKADLADDRGAWEYWWEQNKAKWTPAPAAKPPDDGKRGGKRGKGKERGEGGGGGPAPGDAGAGSTSVRFHGIPVYSDRVVFVIDCSGGMQNTMPAGSGGDAASGGERPKIEVSKEELNKTIASLPKEVLFNLIFYGTEVKAWQPRLVPAAESVKSQAQDFVTKQEILGRTNFYGALARALEDPQADTAYFLTDGGMTTEGKYIDQRRITRKLLEIARYSLVEIDCLLFGSETQRREGSASRRWLEGLADATGGKFYIRPE
jgi:hypothetical protein